MSNLAYIQTVEVKKTYAEEIVIDVRVWDNFTEGDSYIGEKGQVGDRGVDVKDDMSILQYCKDIGSDDSASICSVIDSILENKKGVEINGTFYEWDKIKHIFPDN